MTTVRFVGELPLWVGLILSLLVCGLSWRYYRRESFDLPRRLRWLLPLLRSLAFFLGIMVLTQPVLHHRKVIGDNGHVGRVGRRGAATAGGQYGAADHKKKDKFFYHRLTPLPGENWARLEAAPRYS